MLDAMTRRVILEIRGENSGKGVNEMLKGWRQLRKGMKRKRGGRRGGVKGQGKKAARGAVNDSRLARIQEEMVGSQ